MSESTTPAQEERLRDRVEKWAMELEGCLWQRGDGSTRYNCALLAEALMEAYQWGLREAAPPEPRHEVDDTCDHDWGKKCRDLWPQHPDSWCQGCLFAEVTELREAARPIVTTSERTVAEIEAAQSAVPPEPAQERDPCR